MDNRFLTLVFTGFFVLLAVTLGKAASLLWDVASLPGMDLVPGQLSVAAAIGIGLAAISVFLVYRDLRARTYVEEVIQELALVAWPTWKETQKSTVVVIIFSLVLGGFLFGIDKVWSFLTNLILVNHS